MDHLEIIKLFASFGMPGLALFVLWYWVSKGVFKDARALGYAVAGVLALALGSIIYSQIHPQPDNSQIHPQPDNVWPDRRIVHLDHSASTHVVNVMAGDTLKLRSGPGTASNTIAEIPADGGGIAAFYLDIVWDGDTFWYPVKWQGKRGYVGRRYLAGL
jgi:hypothetical protein